MSSKIHRESQDGSVSPMSYRHFNVDPNSAGGPQSQRIVNMAGPDPSGDELRRTMEAQIIQAREQGRAQGKSEAQAEVERAAAARMEPALRAFESMAKDLAQQKQLVRTSAEEDVVKLSIAIAQRILRRELSTDPEAVLGLVKAALGKLQAREMRRLKLAPQDAALVETHRSRLDLPQGLQIVADASLLSGSAIFETTRGELDASTTSQLAEIERGLTDLLKRRK